MDRLTYLHMRGSENDGYYLRPSTTREKANAKLAAYEATGRTPEQLAALVKAQAEGRLHIAPYPDGTPIYCIVHSPFYDEPAQICEDVYKYGRTEYLHGDDWRTSRAEAVAALAKEGGGQGG